MSSRRLAVVLLGLLWILPAAAFGQTVEFVDANGAAAAVYAEAGRAYVRVQHPAANVTTGWDTVSVQLTSSRAGDYEILQLTETGAATGVFLGSIPLAPDAGGGNQFGVLETGTDPDPPYTRDTIEASYNPGPAPEVTDTATMVGSILRFQDAQGRPATAFGRGERLYLRLEAPLTNDPINQNSLLVVLQSDEDSENFYLIETGVDTGVYEYWIESRYGAGSLNNGILEIGLTGGPVTATYQDSDVPTSIQAVATVGESRTLFVTAQGAEAEYYLERSRAYVRVFYDSPFLSSSNVDSINATVTSVNGGDSEGLTLQETGPATDVFTGSIQLSTVYGSPYLNNGVVETQVSGPPYQFDTLNVTFQGNYGSSSDSVATLGSLTSFLDAYGNETSSYVGGERIYVRVEDQNFNYGFGFDTLSATVQSLTTQDAEQMTLNETSRESGVFEGSLESRVGVAPSLYNGRLEVGAGETIQAMHTDANGLLASGALATIRYAGVTFVDADGRPTTRLLERGTVRVRVFSPSDSAPGSLDTIQVLVTSRYGGDSETVTLTETGPATGVFEGTFRLTSNLLPGLEVRPVGPPEFLGDEVTAFYGTATATARTEISRVEFLDAFGRVTDRLVAGSPVRLRVTDYGRNSASYWRETVSINLQGCADDEVLTLQETGLDTGVFEGQIPSATVDSPGVLTASPGCEVVARYDNPSVSTWTEARATYTSGTLEFVDAQGNPASVFLEGSNAWVRLEAPVYNLNPTDVEAVYSVTVQSTLTGDQGPAYLYETGPNTGVFTGSVHLWRGAPSPYDERLDIDEEQGPPHRFDTLTARLPVSPTEELTDTASTLNYRIWFVDSFGQVVTSFAQGQRVYVRMEDYRFNNPTSFDRTYARVNSSSGDQAFVELLETGRNTGIFEGSIALDSLNPPSGDNMLQAGPGATITAIADDSSFAASPAQATIEAAALEFIDADGRPTRTLLEDDYARVRLYSAQANGSSFVADVVQAEISSLYFPDQDFVTLTETGPDTGVFEGAIRTRIAHPAAPGEIVLDLATSGSPLFLGDELTVRYGPYTAQARMTGARVVFLDAFGRETSSLALGAPVRVRVTDYRRNDSGIRDSHPIDVVGCGDSEVLTLQETGFDTAVFEGALPSTFNSGGPGNGVLNGFVGCQVEAPWNDSARPDRVTARGTFTGGSLAFTDAQGNLTDVFLENTRAYVRVEAAGKNLDPGYPDALYSVQVTSDLTGDLVGVSLYETGPDTGVFTGSFLLNRSYPSPYDDALAIGEDPGPPHRFDTMTARLSFSPTDEATATATTLNYRIWFIDGFGQVVNSYAQGTRVYVRMEDFRFNNPTLYDRTYARVTASSGDQVFVELQETGRNTGIFEGSVALDSVNPPSADTLLQAGPGAAITAVADDSSFAASPAEATIEIAALEFIDEAGQPTATVLENGSARVRLYNAQSNPGPAVDTTQIEILSLYGNDRELVTLTETGGDTGVFEGTVRLLYEVSGSQDNGTLEVRNSGTPEYLGDLLTARSGPYSATARTAGARVVFVDAFGRETTSLPVGSPVRVRVTDFRRNDPQLRDNHPIDLVSCNASGDSEVLTLQETGFNTGVYEGSLNSSFNSGGPGDSVLYGFVGCTVEARWSDLGRPNRVVARATFGGGSMAFTDAQGNLTSVFLEGSRAYLRVEAPGSNLNPGYQDVLYSVQVRSDVTGDQIGVGLYETGPDTGVFTGSFRLNRSLPSPYNEELEIGEEQGPPHRFDTLTARWSFSPTDEITATATTLNYRIWFIDGFGQVVNSYAQGTRVYVRMEDFRFNNFSTYDRTYARVTSSSGDQVYIELLETGRNTGIFEGSIALDSVNPPVGDNILQAGPGAAITAVADDSSFAASPAQATIEFAALEFIDDAGQPTATVLENGPARVRLYNAQSNTGPAVDTTQIEILSLYGNDRELVTLTETGGNTGVFEGSVRLLYGMSGSQDNGTLEVLNSGNPEYLGDLLTARSGPYSATARTAGARVVFLDAFGRETTSLAAGSPVRVRVTDHRRNDAQLRDSHPIDLSGCGDSEVLTLQETGFNTAVYEGSLNSSFGSGGPGDGVLTGFVGCTVEARWSDLGRPYWATARATFGGGSLAFTDAQGNLTSVFLENTRAYLRVEAAGSNINPGYEDSLGGVQVVSDLTGDQVSVALYETGPDTGIFTGSFRLNRGLPSPYNEELEVGEEQGPPHRFDTLTARWSFSPTDEITATATTLNYRIWFLDGFGQVVNSYAQGTRVYVRMEDFRFNNFSTYDRTYARVTSSSGDQVYIELLETGRNTGIFEGSAPIDSVNPPVGDNILQAGPGAAITAVADDSSFAASPAQATIEFAALEFIDDAGQPAATVLEDGPARVRLYNAQSNTGPAVDTTQIEVRSLYGNDRELVTLTETGGNTGVFEGSVRLFYGIYGSQDNGTLEVLNSGTPEYLGDLLTARSGPYSATARTAGARVVFVDAFGRETSSLAAGSPVRVRVTDFRRNDPQLRDNHPIDLSGCGDSEVLTLQETGFNTGVYEGSLNSSFGSGGPGDGVLSGFVGCTVEARWSDLGRPYWATAQASFGGGSLAFTDAQGNLTGVFLENTRAYLRVEAAGSNNNPGYQDTLNGVQVTSDITGDQVYVNLYETGPDTGVFTGSYRLSRGAPSPYNDELEIGEEPGPPHRFDTMTARWYLSPTDELTATATTLNYRIWFLDGFGQVVNSYAQGTRVYVRMEDHRYNNPSTYDRGYARVNSSSGDQVYIELLETGRNTGIFEGSAPIDSVNPPAGDEILQAGPGAAITAVADDSSFAASPAQATIEFAALEFIDDAGQPTATVLENGLARVRLYNAQSNTGPAVDTTQVEIRSQYGNDRELVTLTETGGNTGVFEGSVRLIYGAAGSQDNGTLEVMNSGTPEYLGDLLTARSGPYSATARTAGARVVFLDAFGRETSSLAPGSPVRVRVTDFRRNDPLIRDSPSIDLSGCGDSEVLSLLETGFNTGVYEGSLNSSSGSGVSGDGVLNGFIGCTVEARWSDLGRPSWVTAQASFGGGSLAFTDAQGNLTGVFLNGSRAYLRTESANFNSDPVSPDTLYGVQVVSDITGDQVNAILYETGPNTGVFTGSFELRTAVTPSPYNDTLEIGEEQGPPHRFDTMTARLYLSPTDELTATATTRNYRVWFLDAFGQVTDSYVQGARVYVRIEDHRYSVPNSTVTIGARLTSSSGDTVLIQVQETAPNSRIFEGSVLLDSVNPPAADQALQAGPGATITAVEDDGSFVAEPAEATIAAAALEFVDDAGNPAAEVLDGGVARVRLYSAQDNGNPSSPDSVQVQVASLYAGDFETVFLSETGPDTGVFEGTVQLSPGFPGSPGNGRLETLTSGAPEYLGDRLTASYGPYSATARTVAARVTFLGVRGEAVTSYPLRSIVRVRIEDRYRDQTSGVDSFPLEIESLGTGDRESIVMTETGAATGVFLGSLPESDIAGAGQYDGTLSVVAGQMAEARHSSPVSPFPITARVTFRGTYAPEVTDDVAETVEEQPVVIRVLDNDIGINTYMTVGGVTQGAHGSVVIGPLDVVTYTPEAGFVGTDTFTYIARDDIGDESLGTVTVTVVRANEPPVANPDTMYVDEDGSATFDVLLNDTDPDNDPVTFVGFPGGAQHGTISASSYTYAGVTYEAVDPNWNGTDTFEYRISDSNGALALGTVTVIVRPVNDAPVAVDDTATVNEDGSVVISVLANDTDVENDTLTISAVAAATNGSAVINPDGTVTFTPAANFSGTASFDYAVSDGNGGEDIGSVTVTITAVNDAPTANNDTATVEEDGAVDISVLANDTDPENNTLSVTAVTQGTNGAVVINANGTVKYTPAASFSGTDSFTYTISDGNGGASTATVTVTVTAVNDAPTANADSATVAEDGSVDISVLANDTDPENDTLSVTAVTQGTNGAVVINANGTVTYTPAANFSGTDSFTYTISDGNGGTATGTVNVTVTGANDAPTANADSATVAEDGSVAITVLANDTDPDNDTLSVTSVTQGTNGAVVINANGTVTYTPAANFSGTDSFTYTISDGNGGTSTATVTVTVTAVNDAPTANADSATVAEDGSVAISVLANDTDPENDTLSVTAVTQGTNGAVAINANGTVTYTPAANFSGADSFAYTISDGNGGTSTATVTVTITGVNDAPTANADSATVAEDGSVNISVLANDTDPENDTLSVTAVTQGTNGTVAINANGTVTYTPAANFSGADSFTYTISDGNGGTSAALVSVTVTSANDAPVAVNDAAAVDEDGTVAVAVLANDADPDGDSLTVASVTQGTNGAVVINANGTVSYTPAANFKGTDSFTYTIADGNGGGSTATVTVSIASVNDAPVANNDAATVAEDGFVDIDVVANDTDADNDTLTVTSVTQGNGGTVSINANGTVKYTPSANFNGGDTFTYTVSDGNGGNALATVTITVNADNDAPTANDDSAAVAEDGSVSITVLANDSDPENDTLSVTSVTQGAHGAVTINANGSVTYAPAANFNGGDTFTYTISDGNGGTDTATVTVSVSAVNDAPVANDDIATVDEDGSTSFAVLGNDTDVDGDSLSVASVTQGASGAVSINANGTLMYTPSANFNGNDSFTYTVSDGNGGTDTATVTVTISAVNDPPTANADSAAVAEDGFVNVAVLGNDSDPESDTLTVTAVTQGSFGAVSINPDKTVRYAPSANYNGADSFTYTISDGNGGSATATVTMSVAAVNDAPVAVNDSAAVAAGAAVTVSVLANDSDIDSPSLTITGVTQGAKGSVAINANGTVTYTAGLFSGSDSFTYTISDGNGGTTTGTVNVTLQAPARVTSGIQTRYDFNEGSGSTVNDTSGVGTPLNLTIGSTSSVTWLSGGLSVNTATAITNNNAATKIINAVRASNEITVEAWITPDSTSLTGPARILQLWKNNSQRNLVFGQSGNRYETQLKTSTGTPSLLSPASSVTLDLVHLVYTRNSAGQTVYYINGSQVTSGTASGNLSGWATDHKLSLADNWRGDYFLLAVYGRALTSSEVQQNFLAGQNAN
ncbi:MAG TPA: Ig-like domain-containing protein [Thermoanaerobaculia bacterium]